MSLSLRQSHFLLLQDSRSWVTNQLVFCDMETLEVALSTIRGLWVLHALQDNCRMFCLSPFCISEIDEFCKNYSKQCRGSSGYPILQSFWRIQWSSLKCDCYPALEWDFAVRCSWLRSTWDRYHSQKRSSWQSFSDEIQISPLWFVHILITR